MRIRLAFMMTPMALLITLLLFAFSHTEALTTPLGPHCISSGPISLPPDYCGCTWGGVYYRGQAVVYAPVSLAFATQNAYTMTQQGAAEAYPFYTAEGHFWGARLNDVMTVTAQLAGQTIARAFRARPDTSDEQEVPLVFPEQGIWESWLPKGYARSVATQGTSLWAGGSAGVIAVDLTDGVTTTHTLPWPDPAVVALIVDSSNQVWVAGPHNLARYDGAIWQNQSLPFSTTLRTMVSDPATGAIWVAGWDTIDTPGSLAVYNTQWQQVTAVTRSITALALDSTGALWAGTWGEGAYRHDPQATDINLEWAHYTVADGLASNEIYDLAAGNGQLWFATNAYRVNGQPLGGVSRYTVATGAWRTFTSIHGIPNDPVEPTLLAPIYTIATDGNAGVWMGTIVSVNGAVMDAIYTLATPERWLLDHTTAHNRSRALVAVDQLVIAAGDNQVEKLDRRVTPGTPPTVQITTAPLTFTVDATMVLTATASDTDEEGGRILGWEWLSDRVGQLCTTARRCVIPGQLLGEGSHQIQVRVQDDEGVWSTPSTVMVTVKQPIKPPASNLFLPLVRR